jgi:hypothetical protein
MAWKYSAFDELPVINVKLLPLPKNRKLQKLQIKNYKQEDIFIILH